MSAKEQPVVYAAHAAPTAGAPPPIAAAVPVALPAECYMPDWTQEKRRRFEELAVEMEWDMTSIKVAAHALAGAVVVVIADDSGSMCSAVRNSPVPPPPGKYVTTRWDELVHFLQLVTRIGAELAGEVDFHFLNAGSVEKVEAWEQVAPVADRGPTGYTPLIGAMRAVFAKYDPAVTDRRLITIIATDGVPSDLPRGVGAAQAVSRVLHERPCVDKSFVTFLSCTDNDQDIAYIKHLDANMRNVDEVDDFNSERAEVARAGYRNFSVGDWALRAAVGAAIRAWDKSDEGPKFPGRRRGGGGPSARWRCCLFQS
jgi:hypothetical protein